MMGWNPFGEYEKYALRVLYWHKAWEGETYLPTKEHYGRLLSLSARQCAKWAKEFWPDLGEEV